jgi:hypothetical protein
MRQKNWRLLIVGIILLAAAAGFFTFMQTMAPRSNDPAAMMQTVGQVSGAVGGIGFVMLLFGLVGKKPRS